MYYAAALFLFVVIVCNILIIKTFDNNATIYKMLHPFFLFFTLAI